MIRGFTRLSAAVPSCGVADVTANEGSILELWRRADSLDSSLLVVPG